MKNKDKTIYDEPPMIWDVALQKFVPDLSKIKKKEDNLLKNP
jgi:hypothetical protein